MNFNFHPSLFFILRKIRLWYRSPLLYLRRAKKRFLGLRMDFLEKDRSDFPKGSFEWLVLSELLYGGFQTAAAPTKSEEYSSYGAVSLGGDRMSESCHGYGRYYCEFLKPFINKSLKITLLEVGILNGSGLAIWCDLFPTSRIVGLDINLANFQANFKNLKALGAFILCEPEVHEFDQLNTEIGSAILRDTFQSNEIDIVVDDGCHTLQSIESTFMMLEPYLADKFVYFIEDNFDAFDRMVKLYPQYCWKSRGELTICRNRV